VKKMNLISNAGIWIASVAGAATAAPPVPEVMPQSDPRVTASALVSGVSHATVQRLGVDAGDESISGTVAVQLDGVVRLLELARHSMRAPDCAVKVLGDDLQARRAELPPEKTWRGAIAGEPGSSCAVTIDGDRVFALICGADGRRWAIQPAEVVIGEGSWSVVYENRAVLPAPGECGVAQDALHHGGAEDVEQDVEGGPMAVGSGVSQCQIAFTADYDYFVDCGSSVAATITDIETVMNNVGLIYQEQTSICYRTAGYLIHSSSNDPYTEILSDALLCQFREYWNDGDFFPSRDVAHLFTGKELFGTIIGLAWKGVICNANGWSDECTSVDNLAYGLSQSHWTTNMIHRTQLTAHELGHNWDACHCNQSECTGGGADADCGIMWSSISGSTTFGSRSLAAIGAYRASATCLSTCVDPIYVNGSFNGVELGTLGNPFNTVLEGTWSVMIGSEVRVLPMSYPENLTFNKKMTLTRFGTSGSVVIGN